MYDIERDDAMKETPVQKTQHFFGVKGLCMYVYEIYTSVQLRVEVQFEVEFHFDQFIVLTIGSHFSNFIQNIPLYCCIRIVNR